MKVTCPKCRQAIAAEQVNVAANVVYCTTCAEAFSLSELVTSGEVDDGELDTPPKGCWFQSGFDDWQVGASTRSYAAWFLVPFMCVWNGFSLGGIYGTQIVKGQFDLFQSLFGIPFLLGTLIFGSIAVMMVCGKVVLSVVGDQADLFTGVGALGWHRRFAWSDITRIVEPPPYAFSNNPQNLGICLEGTGKRIRFATFVSEGRRAFLLQVLRRMVVKSVR
jgi:hypothetical protein